VGSVDPTKKLRLQAEYHNFWLDSKTDSWTGGNGSFGRDQLGKSGRHTGQELDAFATYRLSKFVELEAGVAHFFAESFAHNIGRPDDANFAYVQTILRF
jgi:hypothetical protein